MYLKTFESMCFKTYELDPASGLPKKPKVKLDLLTDIDMLIMVEKKYWRNMSYYSSICKS